MTWRDKYKVHPAANVFPMMSDEELEALGQDILENGLREPIKIMRVRKAKQIAENAFSQPTMLLDGRNRLEAMERVGIDLDSCAVKYQFVNSSRPPFIFDAVAYIISLNIHRRHLTKQQQAELIVAAVKAGEKPRQVEVVSRGGRGKVNTVKAKAVKIAEQAGVSKSTVERAIVAVDAKERGAVPRPNKIAGRPLKTKPKLETHTSIDVARRYYLEQCQQPTSISTPSRTSSSMHYARSRARGRWRDRPSTMPSSRVRDHERYSRHRHDAHRVDQTRAVE